jgi:aspartyl-tRNA(Asn)/glutamyl-tRNA(Gln) amidotransferase subunit A
MEMCLAALGTQTGGSIIRPAAYCGVAGLKPAIGGVDMQGVFPVSYHLDHLGPLARSVDDLYLVWQQIANRHSENTLEYLADKLLGANLNRLIDQASAAGPLLVAKAPWLDRASPETLQHLDACLAKINTAVPIEPWNLPDSMADVHRHHRLIMAVEAAQTHRTRYAEHRPEYGPRVSELIEEGLAASAVDYAAALHHQRQTRREMLQLLQSEQGGWMKCLVMPSTPQPAPDSLATTGDPSFNSPWSYVGLPAATIPTGLSAEGMPLGLQFVSPLAIQALATAALAERMISFKKRSPLLEKST